MTEQTLHQSISPFIKREVYAKAVESLDAALGALTAIGYQDGDALLDEVNAARKSAILARYTNERNCRS